MVLLKEFDKLTMTFSLLSLVPLVFFHSIRSRCTHSFVMIQIIRENYKHHQLIILSYSL